MKQFRFISNNSNSEEIEIYSSYWTKIFFLRLSYLVLFLTSGAIENKYNLFATQEDFKNLNLQSSFKVMLLRAWWVEEKWPRVTALI